MQREALLTDYALQWLVTTPLYNIGEHVYNLSDEFKEVHSDIPWGMIAGLRHRLVHDYRESCKEAETAGKAASASLRL